MNRRLLVLLLAATVAYGASVTGQSRSQTAPARPALAVIVVVDQMRADYVTRFQNDWTGGLKRLVQGGAWFQNAAYPYLTTVTCAGHATVGTGTFPHTHGIIQNAWWDRARQAMVTCTADPQTSNVGYATPPTGGEDGRALSVPTFADILRTEHAAHVVTLSLKARSAIMLAGHGADAALWLSDKYDAVGSSMAFDGERALSRLRPWLDAHPIAADVGKSWTLMLPPERYPELDDAVGEAPPRGWTRTFPHDLKTESGKPDGTYFTRWEATPYANDYLEQLAAETVGVFGLGQDQSADLLGLSFSTPDLVGHDFGPRSREIHDIYVQLDRTVGALLDELDRRVGKGRYVLALTADHGVTELPEQRIADHRGGGRLEAARVSAAIEARAQSVAGPGKYVARLNGNDIYFLPGMYDKLRAVRGGPASILDALKAIPGIHTAFTAEEVQAGARSSDRWLRAANLSYFPGRSGDMILATEPGWMFGASGATHGSANDDDQRVPVLFYGAGIKHGAYADAASPADVAPTLAKVLGVRLPRTDGHVLSSALAAR